MIDTGHMMDMMEVGHNPDDNVNANVSITPVFGEAWPNKKLLELTLPLVADRNNNKLNSDSEPGRKKKRKAHRHSETMVMEIAADSGTDEGHIGIQREVPFPSQRKKKRGKSGKGFVVKTHEIHQFFRLLCDHVIYDFLTRDSCKKISDKYLLAMVFSYFKRANYDVSQYTRLNFFVALYLANDIEEDEEDFKYEIFPWALGSSWQDTYLSFLTLRDKLWAAVGYRAVVSSRCCEEIMSIDPNNWAWKRDRPVHHGGAKRLYMRSLDDDDGYPRGPGGTPSICHQCAEMVQYDSASPDASSWFLSSCSDSSPEAVMPNRVLQLHVSTSNFDMRDLKDTLQDEKEDIWLHDE